MTGESGGNGDEANEAERSLKALAEIERTARRELDQIRRYSGEVHQLHGDAQGEVAKLNEVVASIELRHQDALWAAFGDAAADYTHRRRTALIGLVVAVCVTFAYIVVFMAVIHPRMGAAQSYGAALGWRCAMLGLLAAIVGFAVSRQATAARLASICDRRNRSLMALQAVLPSLEPASRAQVVVEVLRLVSAPEELAAFGMSADEANSLASRITALGKGVGGR